MEYVMLTKEQIAKRFPRAVIPIVAAVAQSDAAPDFYDDVVFTLHSDGDVGLPFNDIPLDDLLVVHRMLKEHQ